MNRIAIKILSITLAILMSVVAMPVFTSANYADVWYVSVNGSDITGTGTSSNPYQTIQMAANMASAGDTVYIMEGKYNEKVTVSNSGIADAPITFKAYADDEVTVRAVDELTAWTEESKNLWVADMDWNMEDLSQSNLLFKNGEPQLMGRHPNLPEGGSVFYPAQFIMDDADRTSTDLVRLGYIVDDELIEPDGYWNGGMVRMQSGLNWFNITAQISSYADSTLQLTGHSLGDASDYNESPGDAYYIYDHKNTLDSEGEWYYDRVNRKMYYWSASNPNEAEMTARNNDYVFDLSDQSYVDIIGINIQGAAVKTTKDTSHINIDGVSISDGDATMTFNGGYINLKNSHFYRFPLTGISIVGRNCAVFNCLIEETGWEGNGAALNVSHAMNCYVGYNTFRKAGRTNLGPAGTNSVYEYNDFYDAGSVTCDTGVTYTAAFSGGTSEFRYNWVHDVTSKTSAFGFYLDNANSYISVHHNVVWDTDDMTGELNSNFGALLVNQTAQGVQIYNNTFIGNGSQSQTMPYTEDGMIKNNIFVGAISDSLKYPAQESNIVGWLDPGFKDMTNLDFTLTADSPAIDSGVEVEGVTEGYVGDAPDIGAYEYGGENWVPGHNWDNPPVFEHKYPNYIQYSNRVAMPGFEASEPRMWEDYGWTKVGEGNVQLTFAHSLTVVELTRRTGNRAVQLGQSRTLNYPGDDIVNSANAVIEAHDNGTATATQYNSIPDILNTLISSSSVVFPEGDFENGTYVWNGESASIVNTDEAAASGTRSMKVSNMKYSWSGARKTIYNTSDRRYRVSFKYKGNKGDWIRLRCYYTYNDYVMSNDVHMGSKQHTATSSEWESVAGEFNLTGYSETTLFQFESSCAGVANSDGIYSGYYYLDDLHLLDMSEAYLMQEICANNATAKAIIDEAIADSNLTALELGQAMKSAAKILLEESSTNRGTLANLLKSALNNRTSPGAGVSYELSDIKPGRTYYFTCHGKVANAHDKVQFIVKQGNTILAQTETSSTTWCDIPLEFTAPANGDTVTIMAWKPHGIGVAYVDDMSVLERESKTYNYRSTSAHIENGDFENSEVWPWYSYDGQISPNTLSEWFGLVKTKCLEVTDGRAMQEVLNLKRNRIYKITAKAKSVSGSPTAELALHYLKPSISINPTSTMLATGQLNTSTWTTLEGTFSTEEGIPTSVGLTVGLQGGTGTFYLDDVTVTESSVIYPNDATLDGSPNALTVITEDTGTNIQKDYILVDTLEKDGTKYYGLMIRKPLNIWNGGDSAIHLAGTNLMMVDDETQESTESKKYVKLHGSRVSESTGEISAYIDDVFASEVLPYIQTLEHEITEFDGITYKTIDTVIIPTWDQLYENRQYVNLIDEGTSNSFQGTLTRTPHPTYRTSKNWFRAMKNDGSGSYGVFVNDYNYYWMPVVYVTKDFFTDVRLDISKVGENVKDIFATDLADEDFTVAGYTKEELMELGYPNFSSISKPTLEGAAFTVGDKTYYLVPDSAVTYNGKTYYGVFHNTQSISWSTGAAGMYLAVEGIRDENSKYVTLKRGTTNQTDIQSYKDTYFSPFGEYIIGSDYEWKIGPVVFNSGDATNTDLYFKGSVGIPSTTEVLKLIENDSEVKTSTWMMTRTATTYQGSVIMMGWHPTYGVNSNCSLTRTSDTDGDTVAFTSGNYGYWSYMTYVSEDFFKNTDINITNTGKYVREFLRNSFTYDELTGWSEINKNILFYGSYEGEGIGLVAQKIVDTENDVISVNVCVNNNGTEEVPKGACLIVASYNGDKFEGVKIVPLNGKLEANSLTTLFVFDFPVENASENHIVKVMLWESILNVVPLCEVITK